MKKFLLLLLLLIVPFMLVGCGDEDDDDESSTKKEKTKTEEKAESKSSKVKTMECSGTISGVKTVTTYSINSKTDEVLVNKVEYTINNPTTRSESEICDAYEGIGFTSCSVKFTSNTAVVTATMSDNEYAGYTFEQVKTQYEGLGLSCTVK